MLIANPLNPNSAIQTNSRTNLTSVQAAMSLGRTFKLNSGYEIPAIGLGTWVSASGVMYGMLVDETGAKFYSSPNLTRSRTPSTSLFDWDTDTSMRLLAT